MLTVRQQKSKNFISVYCPYFYGERNDMKEVFQEYGGVIVTIIAILSLIAVIAAVIGTGEDGIIGSAFSDLIENFLDQAGVSLGGE